MSHVCFKDKDIDDLFLLPVTELAWLLAIRLLKCILHVSALLPTTQVFLIPFDISIVICVLLCCSAMTP